MDPVREMIHLGLRMTEATLDRTLDVVRLVDTLLVASAVPTERETTSREPAWPEEEQADLDALSATLRARKDPSESTTAEGAPTKVSTRKATTRSPATKAPAKKAPAKKTSTKKAPATKASTNKASTKKTSTTKAPTKKAPAKKTSARRTASTRSTASTGSDQTRTPSLVVLPDA